MEGFFPSTQSHVDDLNPFSLKDNYETKSNAYIS